MILLTVGTQLSFDRLIKMVDDIAPHVDKEILCQSGLTSYNPKNFPSKTFLEPVEFEEAFNRAEIIIAHAGMGSILTSLMRAKPIIIVPRLAKFNEHRNDHQLATSEKMKAFDNVFLANNSDDLLRHIKYINKNNEQSKPIDCYANLDMQNNLRNIIFNT